MFFIYLPGQTCHLCHPNEDMVGPRTSATLMLVNLTAYTSEQTFVQIVPLSGAGLLVHLPRLPSGRTLLVPQALHVQDTALHLHSLHLGASNAPGLGDFPQVRASDSCPGLVVLPSSSSEGCGAGGEPVHCPLQLQEPSTAGCADVPTPGHPGKRSRVSWGSVCCS